MSDTGNVNVSGEGKVYGTNVGQNSGTVNTTVNVLPPPPPLDLAAARERFAALPLDSVPDVEPLPAGSRMPLSRNPLFVGRESELTQLAATLKGGGTAAIGQVAAATGLGGIGKTQLACEFVHRYGQFFAGGAFWLSFASGESVPAEIAACGGPAAMNLPGFDALKFDDQVGRVVQEWQGPIPRLLVFDNCEDEALLDRWRPKTGGCRVLVTSRRAQWDPALGVAPLALETLPRHESIALLRKFRPDLAEDDGALDAIAAELGDLPLALHLAGSYLAKYRRAVSPADYLAQLRSPALLEHRSLQSSGISPTGHVLDVGRTFALSYERLDTSDATDALAIQLLARAAYFAPGEPIPRDLLRATVDVEGDDAALRIEGALMRLVELGLIEEEADGALRLHQLIGIYAGQTASIDESLAAINVAIDRFQLNTDQSDYRDTLHILVLHLRHITMLAGEREDSLEAALCIQLGYYLWRQGEYSQARPSYERALAIREQILGPDHVETATTLDDLGSLVWEIGDYTLGQSYHERALAIRERVLGSDHLDIATSLTGLAGHLKQQKEYLKARSCYERALDISERALGPTDPFNASILNNLGVLLSAMGERSAARDCYGRALTIYEDTGGLDDANRSRILVNLGALLEEMGEYVAARACYERGLAIREKLLRRDHPEITRVCYFLGSLLAKLGEYATARSYYERVLLMREQHLGSEHPKTQAMRKILADLKTAAAE